MKILGYDIEQNDTILHMLCELCDVEFDHPSHTHLCTCPRCGVSKSWSSAEFLGETANDRNNGTLSSPDTPMEPGRST